jgi:amino acid transporter
MDTGPTKGEVTLSVFAYVPFLFLIPLAARHKGRFLLYHTRQGLYLFSVFLVVLIVVLTLFYVFHNVAKVAILDKLFAVLVLVDVAGYVLLAILMAGSVMAKKMVMLPVLGELAGER